RLPAHLATRLADAVRPSLGAALAESGGQLHPVCGVWRAGRAGGVRAHVAEGSGSPGGLAKAVAMGRGEWPVAPHGPFRNANAPEDLEALELELTRGDG